MTRSILLLFASIATVGCGFGSGQLHNTAARYTVTLPAPPRFVKTVSGSASSGSVFCVIPLDNSLYLRAVQAMHEAAGHLGHYEFLDNVREDTETQCLLFYGTRNLTVSADVYEARAPTEPPFPMDPVGK